jgi:hypothetical protein
MQTFAVEIRDQNTCIPAVALVFTARNEAEDAIYRKAGWNPRSGCMLMRLDSGEAKPDPYDWPDGTMRIAAAWAQDRWHAYASGSPQQSKHPFPPGGVIDVMHIQGRTAAPCPAEWPQYPRKLQTEFIWRNMHREPEITVNGCALTAAQSMVVRVALSSLDCECGGDAHGQEMEAMYKKNAAEVLKLMPV